jgi:fibronectin type 3 domain-containing protein
MPAGGAPTPSPGQVANLTAASSSANSIALTWSAPAFGGPVASYTVSYRVSGAASWNVGGAGVTSTQFSVAALAPGSSYDFMVTAINGSLSGAASNIVTAATSPSTGAVLAPTGLTASNVSSNSITLLWTAPSGGGVQSYTVQYRVAGTSTWSGQSESLAGLSYTVTGLASNQSYDCQVTAVSPTGSTATSSTIAVTTAAESVSVQAISWNVVPNSTFVHGSGVVGVNAHVTPASAAVRFGLSNSTVVAPASWTSGTYVNTDLWGAYIPTPAAAGTWFAWAEGMDGSAATVYSAGITVT